MSKRMSSADAAFLLLESRDTPMHVGGLLEFTPPEGTEVNFPAEWRERMRKDFEIPPPWNLVPAHPPVIGSRWPSMRETTDIDLDYHVRLWALPRPGGQRELGVLVSRLHSQPLDLRRPPWEVHVIEGLEGGRFAGYVKLHHSLIDGVSAMRLLGKALTPDPNARDMDPLWTVGPTRQPKTPRDDSPGALRELLTSARAGARAVQGLGRAVNEYRKGSVDDLPLRAPFNAPKSPLGARITPPRRFATRQFPLERFQRLAKAGDATLNDIVLYVCGTALRNYLLEHAEVPERSLTAGLPVNVRDEGDERVGTAIGFIVTELGTHLADPRQRLDAIKLSAEAAKRNLRKLPKEALAMQAVAVNGPWLAGLLAGLRERAPIPYNVVISNVPGPKEPLYLDGARLDGMYPMSMITHGNAMNITCLTYVDTINFGFIGARDNLPHMQRIATGMNQVIEELEGVLLGA